MLKIARGCPQHVHPGKTQAHAECLPYPDVPQPIQAQVTTDFHAVVSMTVLCAPMTRFYAVGNPEARPCRS